MFNFLGLGWSMWVDRDVDFKSALAGKSKWLAHVICLKTQCHDDETALLAFL